MRHLTNQKINSLFHEIPGNSRTGIPGGLGHEFTSPRFGMSASCTVTDQMLISKVQTYGPTGHYYEG